MKIKTKYIAVFYLLFIFSVVAGLLWFRFIWLTTQSVKAFTSTAASFHASHLSNLTLYVPLGKPLLVHFVDSQCPCTKYSAPYIHKLKQETKATTIHVMSEDLSNLESKNAEQIANLIQVVPASPAVAIWNSRGELSYFGPYSSGAYCGDGEDMVRYVLDSLKRGDDINWLDQEAQGCMCAWKN